MIEPCQNIFYRLDASLDAWRAWQRRPAQHDHRQAERAGCGDLAVARIPAAVLGNDDLDPLLAS